MAAADWDLNAQKIEPTPNDLFGMGGKAAYIAAAFAAIQIAIEVIGVGVMHIEVPTTVIGWFLLLHNHTLIGLTELTMFQIPMFILCIPVFLALYFTLRRTHRAYLMIATTFAILGIAIYLASNTVFSMLSLSRQYEIAATDVQRSMLLAAGQAMLAIYEGSGVVVGLFLVMISVLMISAIMLRSSVFNKTTAYVGILTGVVSLAYYIFASFTPMAIFILEAAGLLFVVWVVLAGRRLLQLRHTNQTGASR